MVTPSCFLNEARIWHRSQMPFALRFFLGAVTLCFALGASASGADTCATTMASHEVTDFYKRSTAILTALSQTSLLELIVKPESDASADDWLTQQLCPFDPQRLTNQGRTAIEEHADWCTDRAL
jgi:hypothetical protein